MNTKKNSNVSHPLMMSCQIPSKKLNTTHIECRFFWKVSAPPSLIARPIILVLAGTFRQNIKNRINRELQVSKKKKKKGNKRKISISIIVPHRLDKNMKNHSKRDKVNGLTRWKTMKIYIDENSKKSNRKLTNKKKDTSRTRMVISKGTTTSANIVTNTPKIQNPTPLFTRNIRGWKSRIAN